jgi:hypothetical protein
MNLLMDTGIILEGLRVGAVNIGPCWLSIANNVTRLSSAHSAINEMQKQGWNDMFFEGKDRSLSQIRLQKRLSYLNIGICALSVINKMVNVSVKPLDEKGTAEERLMASTAGSILGGTVMIYGVSRGLRHLLRGTPLSATTDLICNLGGPLLDAATFIGVRWWQERQKTRDHSANQMPPIR